MRQLALPWRGIIETVKARPLPKAPSWNCSPTPSSGSCVSSQPARNQEVMLEDVRTLAAAEMIADLTS